MTASGESVAPGDDGRKATNQSGMEDPLAVRQAELGCPGLPR